MTVLAPPLQKQQAAYGEDEAVKKAESQITTCGRCIMGVFIIFTSVYLRIWRWIF